MQPNKLHNLKSVIMNASNLQVSSSCSSVYVDGSEIRGSSNASVLVKYGTYTGLARFTVWMPELPLEVSVADTRLNQIKGWKVPEEHVTSGKSKRSLLNTTQIKEKTEVASTSTIPPEISMTARAKKRSAVDLEESIEDTSLDVDDPEGLLEEDEQEERFRPNGNDHEWDTINSIDRNLSPANCRLRFQQSPIEVHARFLATDHDSGRVSYFVNRRTWLRVTDLVAGMLRVSDPRIATLLQGRLVQGRGVGRTEVQVLSPITGRVIGAKEIRVGNDRVSVTRLSVRVVSGLQLSISPDTAIENGYIAETSVTRRLTAQYQVSLIVTIFCLYPPFKYTKNLEKKNYFAICIEKSAKKTIEAFNNFPYSTEYCKISLQYCYNVGMLLQYC